MKKFLILTLIFCFLPSICFARPIKISGKRAFKETLGEDEVIIGDEKSATFKPQVKLYRWNKENYLTFKFNETGFSTPVIRRNKLRSSNGNKAIELYKDDKDFKFVIILKKKPLTNTYSLLLEGWEEFDFFYQTPFKNPEHFIRDGKERIGEEWTGKYFEGKKIYKRERPINVDGSYAVYHRTKKNHIIGQTNYRTGKAFHIYRPKATDADGKSAWTDLYIEDGTYTVTIPQDFLNTAKYPVTINDWFGCDPETPGESSTFYTSDDLYGSLFTSDVTAGTGNSITMSVQLMQGIDAYVKGVLVLHSNLNIVTNGVGDASVAMEYSQQWKTSTFSTSPDIAATTEYVLMGIASGAWYLYYDEGDPDQGHYDESNSYADPEDLAEGAEHNINKYSIYCTYEAAAAAVLRLEGLKLEGIKIE